ncbi:PepSY domain-containing protein [Azospirillum canadense]|uniref:PepSY domain-containing protein n=1 Tax=Azospirillum canadense TaxID=403962 RepID=UPI002225F10F|nr:PepSY domain-containing protein [Azospirillum canadense]MCW2241489.1 putative membrane protein YkoI [Azospirillum canadense]
MRMQGPLALLAVTGVLLGAPAFAANKKDVQALNQAKVSLTQAIETATKQGNGKAIDAEFEVEDGGGQYEIKVLGSDKLMKYKLDANSGQVTEAEEAHFEKFFTRLKPEDLRNARTSLVEAIGIAEQRLGGKAIEAEAERESDHIQYEVKVVKPDGSTDEIEINATNGQVAER